MSKGAAHRNRPWTRALAAGALAAAALTVAPSADGTTGRTETTVKSTSPVTDVIETEVSA